MFEVTQQTVCSPINCQPKHVFGPNLNSAPVELCSRLSCRRICDAFVPSHRTELSNMHPRAHRTLLNFSCPVMSSMLAGQSTRCRNECCRTPRFVGVAIASEGSELLLPMPSYHTCYCCCTVLLLYRRCFFCSRGVFVVGYCLRGKCPPLNIV